MSQRVYGLVVTTEKTIPGEFVEPVRHSTVDAAIGELLPGVAVLGLRRTPEIWGGVYLIEMVLNVLFKLPLLLLIPE